MSAEEAAATQATSVPDVQRQRTAVREGQRPLGSGDLHRLQGQRPGLSHGEHERPDEGWDPWGRIRHGLDADADTYGRHALAATDQHAEAAS